MNAKIGEDTPGYERVMGKYGGLGQIEYEERFAHFCAAHSLDIEESLFPHKLLHKVITEQCHGEPNIQGVDHKVVLEEDSEDHYKM